uniref:Anion exchange protein n=1 Tax=Astyanax mexicanus TaxID=7994 RepID=A0A8B9JI45_ASTMX
MQDFWGDVVRNTKGPSIFLSNDHEAVVDLGKTSSNIHTNFEKEELESHRAVYVGVHVPLGRQSRRRHRHRGHRHHRKRREREREDGRESPTYDTPSQRVQFILGTEDDDEEHIPHDLFTELDELSFLDGQMCEWKETARWLKFEEDVEDGGERWSKPYVATLSLHSLFELRSCIMNGTVMLDMRANTIEEIADMIIDSMVANTQLDESLMEKVREAMLKRHHHQNEKKLSNRIPLVRSIADIGKKHSDPHLLERNGLLASPQSAPGNLENSKPSESRISSGPGGSRENSTVDFSRVIYTHYTHNIYTTHTHTHTQIFGGLVMDIRRKAPFYWSDVRDALSLQCLASILFLYCACMSPVITFGGLLGDITKNNISAIESLFGASLTGVAYSLFAGQPLTILGSTGPVLVFEKILFMFCRDYDLAYLPLRTSIGLWTAFLCVVLVATDASSLVCYITRFTEEAFAALICIIFIYEALEKLFHLGEMFPINMHNRLDNLTFYTCQCSPPANVTPELIFRWNQTGVAADSIDWRQLNVTVSMCHKLQGVFEGPACGRDGPYIPDVLFWSVILFFTTFFLSSFLKQFKTKRYFPTRVRSAISDFAVFLTIMIMVVVDYLVGIPSPKLNVPDAFEPTTKGRGWLMSPLGSNPTWTLFAAAIPALLCTILIFMDQQITAVIINRKEHKLKKGCGYHLDLLVVAVMLGVCSVMGLPWFVAATVLSISHVNSLKVESECSAPGEQPKFLGIREQRVTGLMIFVLMGLSVFMTSVLKFIPMPVLYGVFLYMGVSSLRGIQFFDRIKLFGMPAKHQPDLIYLRYVPLWKVHVFTIVQLTCLVLLWVIKVSAAAVVFPMMVLALVFVRKLLDFCFMKRELSWLDDLMPESKKKKEDDKKKKEKEEAERMLHAEQSLEYDGENLLSIKSLKDSCDPSVVNISDEMAKTSVWKSVSKKPDCSKTLKPNASVKIRVEGEDGEKCMDTETSL